MVRVRGAHKHNLKDDVERLLAQLDGLVAAGNTVIVVDHEMHASPTATG